MRSPRRGAVTLLGALGLLGVAGLVAALAGAGATGIARLSTDSMDAAVTAVRGDLLVLACCQLLGLVVATGAGVIAVHGSEIRYREALALRPVPAVLIALALTAGFTLQFPLSEMARALADLWPGLAMDEAQQQLLRRAIHIDGPLEAITVPLAVVAIPAVGEELLFRGVLTPGLERRYGAPVAIGASALLFGVIHGAPVAIAYATTAGLVLGWLRLRTGSVLPCVALHGAFNAVPMLLPAELAAIEGFNSAPGHAMPLALWLGCAAAAAVCLVAIASLRTEPA